jgi:hypothetical protein
MFADIPMSEKDLSNAIFKDDIFIMIKRTIY